MLNLLVYKFVVHALIALVYEQVAWQRWTYTRSGILKFWD